jgi:hypothetical protein
MPGHRKTAIRALVVAGALIACGVGTAQATVIDKGHFSGSEQGVPDNICGIDVVRDSVFSGSFRDRVPKAGDGQAFLERFTLKATDTFTNPDNGKSFSISTNELSNELSTSHVSGNVYEFTTIEAGQPFVVRDGDGNIVLRDRGNILRTFTFDTLGDGQPGGIELDETVVKVSGPHPGFDLTEEQFCGMVEGLIG